MSGRITVDHLEVLAPYWTVPANLADFECAHGELGGCADCELEAEQAAIEPELQLAQVPA